MDKKVSYLHSIFSLWYFTHCTYLLDVLMRNKNQRYLQKQYYQKLNWTNLLFFRIGQMENITITMAQRKC